MMDPATLQRRRHEREVFHRLFDMPASARDAHVAGIEANDAMLAAKLRRLLEDAEAEAGAQVEDRAGDRVGAVIGLHFRLVRLLGIGGMGEVYLAERTDDIEQRVALKLVRSDLPVPIERARRERQILARLVHPNVAGLVDAGLTESGQPWFAMDFVDGERITDWCDHHALDLGKRARLFAQVCRTVQFAHRNLVLHRDLKPSNILVDAEGVPKLLDFGIAKLLDATDAQHTQTLALTPAYAAPEQLRGEPATTASDVYQLGLVLYEVLAGVSAHHARIAARSPIEASTPLPRVDRALTTLALRDHAAAERIAQERGIRIDRLRRSLKGDLGRIVTKATAEDPRERYDTAQALGDDLDRWTDGLPVAAHRGSFAYRANKLVRRHVVAATLIATLALGLVASSVIALNRALQERAQRQLADQQRQHADEQRRLADVQRQRAETLLGFMNDVFRQADPQNSNGEDLKPAQLLERAATTLDQRTDLDLVTRAALKTQIADTFNSMFLLEQGVASAQQALGMLEAVRDQYPGEYLASAIIALDALQMLDRSDEQLDLVARALPLAQAHAGIGEPWIPRLLKFRGAARCSKGDYRACAIDLRASVSGPELPGSDFAVPLNQLAVLMSDEGNANESVRLLRRAEAIHQRAPNALIYDVGLIRHNLATGLYSQGNFAEAMAILQELLHTLPPVSGADAGVVTATLQRGIARIQAVRGAYDEARNTINGVVARLAEDHAGGPRHAQSAHLVAAKIALDRGRSSDAFRHIDAADDVVSAHPEGMAFQRVRVDAMRGEALLRSGRCAEAAAPIESARTRLNALIGDTPSLIRGAIEDSRGRCALLLGNLEGAKNALAEAIAQFRDATGGESPSTLRSEIHALQAQALATRDIVAIAQLEEKRTALARVLGTEELAAIWQLDLIIDALSTELGLAPTQSARTSRARAQLEALTAGATYSPSSGLNGFD